MKYQLRVAGQERAMESPWALLERQHRPVLRVFELSRIEEFEGPSGPGL